MVAQPDAMKRPARMSGGPHFLRSRDAPAELAFFPVGYFKLFFRLSIQYVDNRSLKRMRQTCPGRNRACLFEKIIVSSGRT